MFFNKKRPFQRVEYITILITLALLVFGLLILKSATNSYEAQASYMKGQYVATLLGLGAMFVLMFTPPKLFKKLDFVIYLISVGLLVYTLLFGQEMYGSKSWVDIGGYVFQPAEFAKVGLIVSLSGFMDRAKDRFNDLPVLLILIVLALIPIALILKQPDNGTAIVTFGIIAVMFFIGGLNFKYILAALGILAVGIPIYWSRLPDYARDRIFIFLDPESDILGKGLQGYMSKISIGSGKFWGTGLFKGVQNNSNYTPFKHSDFIFAVIGEELGLFGGIILISLYGLLITRMIFIAKDSDYYSRVLISGVVALFFIHIWENIAMTMNLMPITGIPLPFVSHGGTFQVANLICIGLVLGIKYHKEVEVKVPGAQIENLLSGR